MALGDGNAAEIDISALNERTRNWIADCHKFAADNGVVRDKKAAKRLPPGPRSSAEKKLIAEGAELVGLYTDHNCEALLHFLDEESKCLTKLRAMNWVRPNSWDEHGEIWADYTTEAVCRALAHVAFPYLPNKRNIVWRIYENLYVNGVRKSSDAYRILATHTLSFVADPKNSDQIAEFVDSAPPN